MTLRYESDSEAAAAWPGVFDISARTAFLGIVGLIAVAWIWFILHDLIRVFGPVEYPMWVELFATNRPIEWLQWFVLVTSAVLAAYLSGRLREGAAWFFILMAVGIALIFLEDASDLRHTLYLEYSASLLGEDVAGIPTRIVSDTIFSAFILAVPLYALLGHARTVWPSRSARRFMLAGFGLYALAVGLAALRHLDRFYASLGEAIDSWLLISRWPASPQVPDDMQYFYVVDALLKETVEALGAACLLAMVLAYAAWHRRTEEHRAFPDD